MTDQNIVITEKGLEKLKAELKDFREVRRPEVIGRIKAAKELGDLSENAEYASAKEDQSFIEGRIQELEQIIKKAKVVKTTANHESKTAGTGSQLEVEVEGEKLDFELVGQTESDPVNGKISIDSPVGQALLGQKVGSQVSVQTPDGAVVYKILKIS
jgi:transcription elongation factor GreA